MRQSLNAACADAFLETRREENCMAEGIYIQARSVPVDTRQIGEGEAKCQVTGGDGCGDAE